MTCSTLNLPWLAGMVIAMMPLVLNADTGQATCPALLTEQECHDYRAEQSQARSKEEKALFEDKYTALLDERSRLCPLTNFDIASKF